MKIDEKALQVLIDGGAEVTMNLGTLLEAISTKGKAGAPPGDEPAPAAAPAGGKKKPAAAAPAAPAAEPAAAPAEGSKKGAKQTKEEEMRALLATLQDSTPAAGEKAEEPAEEEE